jgi:hypothetical protein
MHDDAAGLATLSPGAQLNASVIGLISHCSVGFHSAAPLI